MSKILNKLRNIGIIIDKNVKDDRMALNSLFDEKNILDLDAPPYHDH